MFKLFIELVPAIAFFVGYKVGGVFEATLYTLIATIASTAIIILLKQKLSKAHLAINALLLVSAATTLFTENSVFIKIKPTILYGIFAISFFITNFKWEPAIKLVLGSIIQLKDEMQWLRLNLQFMWFFFAMAVTNEFVWRNFSEEIWVHFKIFGALPVTILFGVAQLLYLIKHKK